jgi:signal transduction histidine kinase
VRRLGRSGLRWKLVLALVATSAATLVAAVVALVGPLEHRIAADRLDAMRRLAGTAALDLRRLPARDLRARSPRLAGIVLGLQRRTGAAVALFDARGTALQDTDPDAGADRDAGASTDRVAVAGTNRATELRQADHDREAIVVTPVATHAGPVTLVLRKPLKDSRAAVGVMRRALPLAAGAGLTIALLLGTALSFGLLRRLERLRQGARRLGEGRIAAPLPRDPSRDEVGDLARALESMRARLQAEERSRQAFLGTASHELRTPLALLQATVELMDEALAAPVPDVENARRGAQTAGRQTRRLARLATDLLDLSRLDGEVALRHEPIDLHDIAAAVQAEFEPRARAAGVVLRGADGAAFDGQRAFAANGATPHATATGDESAVARILGILLDNALRYAADGGDVTTTVEVADGHAVLRVADRGAGLAPGERARVFGRFERGAAGERTSGFGLGLAIGRELAQRMGGDLEAVPAERGATFALTLPR